MSSAVKIWLGVLVLVALGYAGFQFIPGESAVVAPIPTVTPGEKPVDLTKFTMTERSGEPYNFDKLKGQVWVANTFFGTCPSYCMAMNRSVESLQNLAELKDVRFVSISVDPVADTPESLAEYAKKFSIEDKERWLFMQGRLKDVNRLGAEMGVKTGYQVHTEQLVVFDHTGRQRGGFKFNSEADIQKMRELLKKLLAEKQAANAERPS